MKQNSSVVLCTLPIQRAHQVTVKFSFTLILNDVLYPLSIQGACCNPLRFIFPPLSRALYYFTLKQVQDIVFPSFRYRIKTKQNKTKQNKKKEKQTTEDKNQQNKTKQKQLPTTFHGSLVVDENGYTGGLVQPILYPPKCFVLFCFFNYFFISKIPNGNFCYRFCFLFLVLFFQTFL